jgi:hypothetical protein
MFVMFAISETTVLIRVTSPDVLMLQTWEPGPLANASCRGRFTSIVKVPYSCFHRFKPLLFITSRENYFGVRIGFDELVCENGDWYVAYPLIWVCLELKLSKYSSDLNPYSFLGIHQTLLFRTPFLCPQIWLRVLLSSIGHADSWRLHAYDRCPCSLVVQEHLPMLNREQDQYQHFNRHKIICWIAEKVVSNIASQSCQVQVQAPPLEPIVFLSQGPFVCPK